MTSLDYTWLAWAFTAISVVRALVYVPQLIAVSRSRDGARDIALSTWIIWILNNVLGALYTGLVSKEWLLSASFVLSAAACLAIVAMTMVKRRQHLQAAPGTPSFFGPVAPRAAGLESRHSF